MPEPTKNSVMVNDRPVESSGRLNASRISENAGSRVSMASADMALTMAMKRMNSRSLNRRPV
ncbi:hypothetical protein [Candidatus Poriferisocius sp.]|uniref:hypothetical protein n=1 Tax=Candidatus Poriferisocius sp. TaxID=3101276 RepID=UPI003B027388